MTRLLPVVLPALLSCAARPSDPQVVNATVDGTVYVTGPVTGAVVSAYAMNLEDGSRGALLSESMPTNEQGAYHLDLRNAHGPILLVAGGATAMYTEPATGVAAHWNGSTELRAPFAARNADGSLRLSLGSGEEGTVQITPWSDWAHGYASARVAARRDPSYADALGHALEIFRDHVEMDYWSVAPTVLTDGPVGAWNDSVQAGVLLAGLSQLAAEMAEQSQLSPAGLSALELVAAVRDDLGDALLDGVGAHGSLKMGTCTVPCALGPLTLRADLSAAATEYLSSTANSSGITAADAQALLGRVASRTGDPWPGAEPPTVTVVPSTFRDDTGVQANVEGPGVGTVEYVGDGSTVALAAGTTATFVKYASRYAANSDNLPEWHFAVGDNHSAAADITLSARLSRTNAKGQTLLLADWFTVPPALGQGFNRTLRVSSAIHPDVALVSGTYTLELQAKDARGAVSRLDCAEGAGCVSWNQTILPPPLRQRQGTDSPVCSDPQVPSAHALLDSPCGSSFSFTAIANLTDARKIALGFIDNPNPAPVQVVVSATAPAVIRRGLALKNIHVASPSLVLQGCNRGLRPELPSGACYQPPADVLEFGADDVLDRDLASRQSLDGATVLGTDATGRTIYEIPPLSTATVWILSDDWSFLTGGVPAYYASLGDQHDLTGTTGNTWLACAATEFVPPHDLDGIEICDAQRQLLETTYLTRVAVHTRSSVTLTTRPSGSDDATWASATGTGVEAFNYEDFNWDTHMNGYLPF